MKTHTPLPCCWITYVTAVAILFVSATTASAATQQMELRENEQYNAEKFAKSKPAVGENAPNLELQTLDGKTVSLDSYRGKNIVVIKSGYT